MTVKIWKEILGKDGIAIGSDEIIEEIINELLSSDKIDPKIFISNYTFLSTRGTGTIRDLFGVQDYKLPEPSTSIKEFASPIKRARAFPIWFIAAYPDVVLWFYEWQKNLLRLHNYDKVVITLEKSKLFGIDTQDIDVNENKIVDKNGKYLPKYLKKIVVSYKNEVKKNIETQEDVLIFSEKDESVHQEAGILKAENIECATVNEKENQDKNKNTIYNNSLGEVHPWRRYWARLFDLTCIFQIYIIIIFFFSPSLYYILTQNMGEYISGYILLFFYMIFFEPMMISFFGTTPGKALLGIRIRDFYDKKISYSKAMGRGFSVWVKGLGLGIPFIQLITMVVAYTKLANTGKTSWDENYEIKVSHSRVGFIRIIFFVVIFIFCLFLLGALMNI